MQLLLLSDLEQLSQTALDEFGQGVTRLPGAGNEDFERHAQRLEAKLEQLYAVAATLAQREDNLAGVAAIWARMVAICDTTAKALADFRQGPSPRSDSYDRILDTRSACEENRALHG